MRMAIINASEEHSQYVGQIYQQHYARLRNYFLTLLGDTAEADACVQDTIRFFFFFMEDRCWEADAEYVSVYLMRIAGGLCSKKLAGRRALHKNWLGWREVAGLLNKIRRRVAQPIKERAESIRLFLRAQGGRQHHLWSAHR
jgi:DNA-directed RNA polymerase specialized sigma24 family protein